LLTFLPMAGALVMLLFMRGKPNAYKVTALVTTLLTFALAIVIAAQFDAGSARFQFEENTSWIGSLGISYHLGIDGISLVLILLTTLLSALAHRRVPGGGRRQTWTRVVPHARCRADRTG